GPAVRDARAANATPRPQRWMRWGLDGWVLAAAGLVFWATSRSSYKLVLAPEGVPGISVNYWAFAGPALLWIGGALVAWRIGDTILRRGDRVLAQLATPVAGTVAGVVAASMHRQHRLLARSLVVVALTVSFAASTAIFNETYRHQAEVDARLTNGANVTVTEPPTATVGAGFAARLERVPGVSSVEPLQHRFAYVGADLQDLYGVRPSTVVKAASLQDAYVAGGSVQRLMNDLAAQPDGVLVSAETVHDFQLRPGDRVTLRLQDGRTKQLRDVTFHYIGVAKEFPTAPRDSFLVANASYVAQATGSDAVGTFLLDTHQAPKTVASAVRRVVGTDAIVTDIDTTRRIVGSSLTAVDLSGLTRVELGFALVLAAAATGLMLVLGLAERRRTFAVLHALGASRRQVAGFLWSEGTFVTVGGLLAGAVGAWTLSWMLVKVLTGVFDPAPAGLVVPWGYLGATASLAVLSSVGAIVSYLALSHPSVHVLRES
ncbi:MAG: putative transport system permease protein, partial [Actinomycetota bacterium]|nr:putative transport system permease protein [Actinomycetota bacterium]